MLLIKS